MNESRSRDPESPPEPMSRRVWIRNVRPAVDGGEFPIKRTVGERVAVTADILADGHDHLSAVLQWKPDSETAWREVRMTPRPDDSWHAGFTVAAAEPHRFGILAWVDRFGSWRDALEKKSQAGLDVESELQEGAALVQARARRAEEPDRGILTGAAERLRGRTAPGDRVAAALDPGLLELMDRWDERFRATRSDREFPVEVARERARTGAWYELFPRSCTPDPSRSGTFRDAAARLPDIAAMGFDVLYLPPIHPIGRTHRKGKNNALEAAPGDPGSPWAIGAAEGGHTAVHPDLGTLEDFDRFLAAAAGHGLEIALDLAFQCSPDHPWVADHPEWFCHRPDGTIKHAENPPKQYQDIYPLDFDTEDWRGLWRELLAVARFWADRGVRIFRVDNPHTKPLRFWQWLIAQVKAGHPDVIFLSEAFTRPKVMYGLAKAGFDQSYTYFTWRNTAWELRRYLTELTRSEVREFFRSSLWPSTPDILPEYLQFGGRAAFQIRLVLAATLGANYGIYSGFELCEGEGLPGREEYRDSEKFEIKVRDPGRPGHIRDFVARVNRIRRENPALGYDHTLRFHESSNDQVLVYSKTTDDLSDVVLVAVNLDPHHAHSAWVEVGEDLGVAGGETYQVHDQIGEGRYLWTGSRNYVHLDPAASPAQIFRLRRRVRTERDFDYFM